METAHLKCETVASVLTENDLKTIAEKAALADWNLLGCDIKPAAEGLSGFLGDHFRMVLHLQNGNFTKKLHLFAKFLPVLNKTKATFIDEFNYFKRENLMYTLFEDIGVANEPTAWCPKALIHTDALLVMPDLSVEGYKSISHNECLDLKHVLVVLTSIARFHATFACYEANRNNKRQHRNSFYEEHKDLLKEPNFLDCPWLRAAAKLAYNFLQEFSTKVETIENFEEILRNLFIKACEDVTPSEDSLNVIIHKDLWINNIFFRHARGEPTDAVLLDFQCIRYAPPAFDVMIFLYLTTTKEFREAHEKEVLNHYYTSFTQHLDDNVKGKLKECNYGRWDFFNWCELARMFAMTEAITIFPFILMEPSHAQKIFDNSDTFIKLMDEDRSVPVLEHARHFSLYRQRVLDVIEEFVDRYVLRYL